MKKKSWDPFRIYQLTSSFAYVLQFFLLISDSLGSVPWLLNFLSTPQPLRPRIFLLSISRITSQIENASKHVLNTDLLI